MKKVERFLEKLDRWQPTGKMNWGFARGEDPKVFRKRKQKSCYCGGHSSHDNKKGKSHHGYMMRLAYRVLRKFKRCKEFEDSNG